MEEKQEDLSPELQQKIIDLFNKLDTDGSKSIDQNESTAYWKENGEANSIALFNAVDVDGSGTIEEEEWVTYFKVVKGAGHTDEEILSELQKFENAVAWVQFDKVLANRRKK